MPNVYFGMIVQTPVSASSNGGVDKRAAIVTRVGGAGPNGGVMVSLQTMPNLALTVLDLGDYIADCEVVDYEEDARALGPGDGAWPLDVSL